MGTKETLADLHEFEAGLSMYEARLKACWTREWHIRDCAFDARRVGSRTHPYPGRRRERVITAIEVLAGLLSVVFVGLMAVVEPPGTKAGLLIGAVALAVVSASFQGLKEDQKRRRRTRLGTFLIRGQQLTRDCQDEGTDWDSVKKDCDVWENEIDAYIRKHFGDAAVALHNSSDGLPSFNVVRKANQERNDYESWCRLRCARLSEAIGRLS